MKVVLSWLREFAPTDLEADELAELITRQGVKVEGIERPWDGVQGVVVARVLEVSDHPNSDKLCVARVDDGQGEQIVCAGVRNFVAGDLVPWAKPGSRVPVLPEPLAPRKLRGVMINGMLCSPRELNIADVHEGILVLNDEAVEVGTGLQGRVRAGRRRARHRGGAEPARLPERVRRGPRGVGRHRRAADRARPSTSRRPTEEAASVATVRIEAADACPRYVARMIRGRRRIG